MKTFNSNAYFILTKNGRGFDIPFIYARMSRMISNFSSKLTPIVFKHHFDLQEITEKRISLQTMAQILGCTPKSGNGLNAIKLWNEGQTNPKKLEELKAYCMQDVDTTIEVFEAWKRLHGGKK